MKNEFKGNIPDYPDYFITSCGRVWSFKRNKFLKPKNNGKGYLFVALSNENGRKNFYIHKLVALTYIPNPEGFDTIDHIDFDKNNNCINNLRWLSREKNSKRQRKIKCIRCIETGEVFNSASEAARAVERTTSAICCCAGGRTKTCAGLHWEYYNKTEGDV